MNAGPDHFAVLGQERRPWLETEALKERFHRLTAEQHPDVNPASDFSAVIAAYQTLSDPKSRVRHLLELEFPGKLAQGQEVPADLLDLFMKIAAAQGASGRVLKKLEAAGSPLAVALLAEEKSVVLGQLNALKQSLQEKESAELQALRAADLQWPEMKEVLLPALGACHQRLSFLQKWSDQIRESLLRLET